MDDEVLELETRRDIYEFIGRFPGLHMREIQRKLDIPIALVEYHLNILEKAEVVSTITEGGYKRYYTATTDSRIGYKEKKILGTLRMKIPLQITLYLLKYEKKTHSEISKYLDIKPSKLSFHLKKLQKLGVVKKLSAVEGKGYIIEDERMMYRLLLAFKPSQDMLNEFADLWESLNFNAWH
jgi:predicted transcriptional regulator